MHSLMDIYNSQYNKKKEEKPVVVEVPQINSLLKHLDLLYSVVLKNQMQQQSDEQTIQYYNPGQGSKSQADSVN
tara:strand:- start:152 stop:373 length:222 start_codon:yes stop_codon:yes gene_type:complete